MSPGTLSPEFSADVDTYSVKVGTDVDQLIVSVETADSKAATQVSGAEGLQMGENRVTVKVTAQDGQTSKEYVIVVTKEEGGASADSQTSSANEAFETVSYTHLDVYKRQNICFAMIKSPEVSRSSRLMAR